MTYIKKLVMYGFKSFARRTEIPMENAMNVIVGPNGSGKSNVTDALCFVLGRLSIKSIRAAKAANLLFSGNKTYKGATEAYVELIFDNEDGTFVMGNDTPKEVSIKRIVKKNGSSTYKINNQTKTRQELVELLAQAGIDPNGFNIVLQGEIQGLVKSTPDERRKIIEDVAGISIYETRKHKSERELEKTEEKLKEVSAVLKERASFLRNLEKEKQDALNYKRHELTIKQCKATLLDKSVKEKEKEIWGLEKIIENQEKEIQKIRGQIKNKNIGIQELQEKVNKVNKAIQSSTSNEQEILHRELSDLNAELAALRVRKENFENRLHESSEKIKNLKSKIKNIEEELEETKTASPEIKEKQKALKTVQDKFDELEKQRRRYYVLKSDLNSLESNRQQKQKQSIEYEKELEIIERNINSLFEEIKYAKSIEKVDSLKEETREKLSEIKNELQTLESEKSEREKKNAIYEQDIKREEKVKEDISKLDICPLCKSQITEEHMKQVVIKANKKIEKATSEISSNKEFIENSDEKKKHLQETISQLETKLNELDIDKVKIQNAEERKKQIKKIIESKDDVKKDIEETNRKILQLQTEFQKLKDIEERYDETRLRLQELSFADVDVDTEIKVKQQELNRIRTEIKATTRDMEESTSELRKITIEMQEKEKRVGKKEKEEKELYEKSQKLFEERNGLQDRQKVLETEVIGLEHTIRIHDEKINSSKIQKAQNNAQLDSIKTELNEIGEVELIPGSTEKIKEKLQTSQFKLSSIGNVNMRALEVYGKIEDQVQQIQEKVETIEKEKEKIVRIIEEIDKKKKKAFLTTLEQVNKYFTRNFSQLSRKGEVFLELENKKEPFSGGLNILIRVSRGRYFDITSLSGGEKTLVALSMIFAIQEYKPYCFYVFDEIDAALDKHNSELLAALIKRYMTTGQYIIVTHNDALISEASALYGVSMQENISKIISLKV